MDKTLLKLKEDAKALWALCCEHDRIDPNTKFIIFSDDNPYLETYNKTIMEYFEAKSYYQRSIPV
jgi:predicted Ser/Thr protein kinase